MSLKRNILTGYASQIYVTGIGILMVPVYLRYLGAEAYGLVGFFAMLQSWFQLLDMGLSPTLGREVARYRGGAISADALHSLIKTMERLFVAIGAIGALLLVSLSGTITHKWLVIQNLDVAEVQTSVALMGLIVALRWICSIYRSAIGGFEKQAWLNIYNAIIATLRYGLVIPFFILFGATPTLFFKYQLLISILELVGLILKTYSLKPAGNGYVAWSLAPLRGVAKFSLSIAFTSSAWVLVSQTDKLVLSSLLPLAEYGYFTLAVLVAGGVNLIGGPISQSILPRLARLQAEGKSEEMIALYRRATKWVCAVVAPVTLTLAFYADRILWAWTGSYETAHMAAPILSLYAIGNGLLTIVAFQYYLQYAKGDLRLHVIGNIVFLVLLIPLVIWASKNYGAKGAGYVWMAQCATYLLVWSALVHRKFAPPKMHRHWLLMDVMPSWLVVSVVYLIQSNTEILVKSNDRVFEIASLSCLGAMLIAASILTIKELREKICSLVS